MAAAVSEIPWFKYILHYFRILFLTPVTLYCDNKTATHIAANPIYHEHTKHIEIDCHFFREKIQEGTIQIEHVSSSLQLANVFTKSLFPAPFKEILCKLKVYNIHCSA